MLGLLVGAAACGGDALCIAVPCALPMAVTVGVTSSASHAAVSGTFYAIDSQSPIPCNRSGVPQCTVLGGAGTYRLTIGAPGFQSVALTVRVSAANDCGCAVNTQHRDVELQPAP